MKTAADYRREARAGLAGAWGMCIAVTLVAVILGGGNGAGASLVFNFDTSDLAHIFSSGGVNFAAVLARMGFGGSIAPVAVAIAGFASYFAIVQFIIGGAVRLGHNRYYIMRIRWEQPEFSTLFSRFEIFGKALGLRLFMALFVILWMTLFIVPGIIAAYRYRMAPYLMAEHPEIGIREAVNESKRLMNGLKWRWFCLDISFIGWWLIACATFGIGFLWLDPYMQAASAAFYLENRYGGIGGAAGNAGGTGGDQSEFEYAGSGTQRL